MIVTSLTQNPPPVPPYVPSPPLSNTVMIVAILFNVLVPMIAVMLLRRRMAGPLAWLLWPGLFMTSLFLSIIVLFIYQRCQG